MELEKFYDNLILLNMLFPPDENFRILIKKDMFSRSNKDAFIHCTHYLLNILDPEQTANKFTTWPTVGSLPRENRYRKELLSYLVEIRIQYPDCDIPKILSSHLVAPSGLKIINFMFKLTQLVIFKTLKKNDDNILSKPQQVENIMISETSINNLSKLTKLIGLKTAFKIKKFHNGMTMFENEAKDTNKCIKYARTELEDIKEKKDIIIKELEGAELPNLSNEEINERINAINEKLFKIEHISKTLSECEEFLTNLRNGENLLHFDPSVHQQSSKNKTLKLMDFFKNLNTKLEELYLHLPVYSVSELQEKRLFIEEKIEECKLAEKEIKSCNATLSKVVAESNEVFSKLNV